MLKPVPGGVGFPAQPLEPAGQIVRAHEQIVSLHDLFTGCADGEKFEENDGPAPQGHERQKDHDHFDGQCRAHEEIQDVAVREKIHWITDSCCGLRGKNHSFSCVNPVRG